MRLPSAVASLGKIGLGAALAAVLLAVPSAAAPARDLPDRMLRYLSQGALTHHYVQNPDEAPSHLRQSLEQKRDGRIGAQAHTSTGFPMSGDLFNFDDLGLPQNEESVARCRTNGKHVLSGTNDFRGILNPRGNFTGWHYSTTSGSSLTKEGLLPAIAAAGVQAPSQGDPVTAIDSACNLYMADLNIGFTEDQAVSGVGIYRTTPGVLAACPGGDDPSCWPTRRMAAVDTTGTHFLDKPWMTVGKSGGSTVVWLTYTDFDFSGEELFFGIKAVRCTATLSSCTAPISISLGQPMTQFSDVTIGPDGRVYITWVEIVEQPDFANQVFKIHMRVAPAGSTSFGPIRTVWTELKPIPFGGFLNANDFRVATYPKSDVKIVNGKPRVYVIWESCLHRSAGFSCENSRMRLSFSDTFGRGWSTPRTISVGGQNYFGTISANPGGANLAVAYWTSRHDEIFTNRQYLELVTLSPGGTPLKRQTLTSPGNESEADTFVGGFFIGDYIEVTAQGNVALVAFNANFRKERFGLDPGIKVPNQDNYLVRATL